MFLPSPDFLEAGKFKLQKEAGLPGAESTDLERALQTYSHNYKEKVKVSL